MKKISLVLSLGVAVLFLIPTLAEAARPLALVWAGPGACRPGCVKGAAKVASRAGFEVQYIYPGLKDFSVFQEAKLWVQPGGHSVTAAQSMGPAMLERVREFVAEGGGYVGFCAGAFLSTPLIGTTEENGYGLIPGETELLIQEGNDHKMLKVATPKGDEWMYYAGGPFFKISEESLKAVNGEIIGRYPDGKIAAIQAHYGKGKVAVSGFHPESSFIWKLIKFKIDRDGSDIGYAVDMVKYATGEQ